MSTDFNFLDFIWKSLFAGTISATVIFVLLFGFQILLKKFTTNRQIKWFYNFHAGFLFLCIVFGSAVLLKMDPELTSACFNRFAEKSDSFNITRLLSGVYVTIFTVLVFLDLLKSFVAFKKIKNLSFMENSEVKKVFNKLMTSVKINSSVQLLVSNQNESPFVWGLFKYKLVLSEALLKTNDLLKIKTILSHEFMHIKDNDSFWLLLSHICKRILFFHPLVYVFKSKHHIVTEMAADEMTVLNCGIAPKKLLESIIEMASFYTKKTDSFLQVNASRGFVELKERVLAMSYINQHQKIFWIFPLISVLSLLISTFVVVSQAQASITTGKNKSEHIEIMCTQIKHEKIIEVWLRMEPSPNKCE